MSLMGKPPPVTPSPDPLNMDAFDRETQQLTKNGQRMAYVTSVLDIFARVLTFLMQSVPMSFAADNT